MPVSADRQRRPQYPPHPWIARQVYMAADGTTPAKRVRRLSARVLDRLAEAGIAKVSAAPDMEVGCTQLCGGGHCSMRAAGIVHQAQEAFRAALARYDF